MKIIKILIFIIAMVGVFYLGAYINNQYVPSFKMISFREIALASARNKTALVIDDLIVNDEADVLIYEKDYLIPVSVVQRYMDDSMFIEGDKILITYANKYIKMQLDHKDYYENGQKKTSNLEPRRIAEMDYVPISTFSALYHLEISYIEENDILLIQKKETQKTLGNLIKNTELRLGPDKKMQIVEKLKKGAAFYIYEKGEEWSRVRTQTGMVGYLKTKYINEIGEVENTVVETAIPKRLPEGKISMLWHQITVVSANPKIEDLEKIPGVTVISPTWFGIKNIKGDLKDIAEPSYVEWAHQNGYEVWPLISNSFNEQEMTHEALSNVETREKMINQIATFVEEYHLDGINVDIENIKRDTGRYFLQFIRELAICANRNQFILSVDMYMPSGSTEHYYRKELGEVIDYLCLMAYDEHWSTSRESGSVASLPWVRKGVETTINLVPKEKVILGIPTYTRLWIEKDGTLTQKSAQALGMESAYKNLIDHQAPIYYDEETEQNYGEYEKDGSIYRIWLEDEMSIEKRLEVMKSYGLAGTATWKKGFEKETIWPIYSKYILQGEK